MGKIQNITNHYGSTILFLCFFIDYIINLTQWIGIVNLNIILNALIIPTIPYIIFYAFGIDNYIIFQKHESSFELIYALYFWLIALIMALTIYSELLYNIIILMHFFFIFIIFIYYYGIIFEQFKFHLMPSILYSILLITSLAGTFVYSDTPAFPNGDTIKSIISFFVVFIILFIIIQVRLRKIRKLYNSD